MSTDQTVDWAAALAEIEAEIERLQATAGVIMERMGKAGLAPPGGGSGGGIRPDSFLKMSIPDATKKLLEIKRGKMDTQAIMDALEKGGLPPSKYNSVYSTLRRRQKQIGDIVSMKGDWGLAEWYPNYRKKAKGNGTEDKIEQPDDEEKATA